MSILGLGGLLGDAACALLHNGELKAAVEELQAKGYALPDYPDDPQTDEEKAVLARYVGWGALPGVFESRHLRDEWSDTARHLRVNSSPNRNTIPPVPIERFWPNLLD